MNQAKKKLIKFSTTYKYRFTELLCHTNSTKYYHRATQKSNYRRYLESEWNNSAEIISQTQ